MQVDDIGALSDPEAGANSDAGYYFDYYGELYALTLATVLILCYVVR